MVTPNLRTVFIAVIVGSLIGIAVFRLAAAGKLPLNLNIPQVQVPSINNERRVVIDEENAVIEAVEKSSPSVVAIGLSQRIFNPFDPQASRTRQNTTIGTGFVVSEKGVVVTNRHVVADSDTKYSVVTKDGKRLEVQKIYRDPNLDLAIVQVNANDLKPIELGDSGKIKVGQTVIAIGHALGRFNNTVTTGVVSGTGRAVFAGDPFSGETEQLDNLIQTDAAINPGNSGGPLLDSSGRVIGLNVATTEGAQNIGFSIPINSIKSVVDEFLATGKISRPYLGVRYRLVSRDLAILNEIPQGAYIQDVLEDSPAEKSGIEPGDIITKIDGQSIDSDSKISEIIQKKKIGDKVSVEIWTDGQSKTIIATLQESPNQ